MTAYLLDANVVTALTVVEHSHYSAANTWFSGVRSAAICPSVQGSLVRYLTRIGESGTTAHRVIEALLADERFEFWSDHLSYTEVPLAGLIGHRQVTDAYLAALAQAHGARLATFDDGLAATHSSVVTLVPSS